ncbi:MAG TPA: hypothetical protein LFW20_05235 [Rickettsia endosymbiont of Omalisus fontisbellaquei]|nr:hypothetical protein [Rickettsia endosymbiont of Omalisus fontisbellaquei]
MSTLDKKVPIEVKSSGLIRILRKPKQQEQSLNDPNKYLLMSQSYIESLRKNVKRKLERESKIKPE